MTRHPPDDVDTVPLAVVHPRQVVADEELAGAEVEAEVDVTVVHGDGQEVVAERRVHAVALVHGLHLLVVVLGPAARPQHQALARRRPQAQADPQVVADRPGAEREGGRGYGCGTPQQQLPAGPCGQPTPTTQPLTLEPAAPPRVASD